MGQRDNNRTELNMSDKTQYPARANESDNLPLMPISKRKHRNPTWGVLVVIIVVTAGVMLHRYRMQPQSASSETASTPPPLMIGTSVAQKGDIGIYLNALGVVMPLNTVSVKSRVDGQLMKVKYQEGQLIHEDDELLEIDS